MQAASRLRLRGIRRDEKGASAVEFAIVAAILIGLCMAILQLGWALQLRNEMARAADQAVRHVMMNPAASDSEFRSKVTTALSDYDSGNLSVATGTTTVGTNEYRTIAISYKVPVVIPGFPSNLVTLKISRRTPKL